MTDSWQLAVGLNLARGLGITLLVSFLSVLTGTLLGLLIATLSVSESRALKTTVRVYIDVFRGVPSLMTLLFVFFALPRIGIETGPIAASVLGLGLWSGANIAEVARGALQSVSDRQTKAARALGMGRLQTLVFAIMPQAARRFLPPYIGQVTVLIQTSTLTSVVGVTEVLGASKQMIERLAYVGETSHAVAIYGVVLAIFFAMCYPMTIAARWLEGRLRV